MTKFTKEIAREHGKKTSRKGIPNKSTEALRSKIDLLINNQWDQFLNDFKELSAKERVDCITRLLEYSIPKMQRTEVMAEVDNENFRPVVLHLTTWNERKTYENGKD